jgi:hypothetical protein
MMQHLSLLKFTNQTRLVRQQIKTIRRTFPAKYPRKWQLPKDMAQGMTPGFPIQPWIEHNRPPWSVVWLLPAF